MYKTPKMQKLTKKYCFASEILLPRVIKFKIASLLNQLFKQ